MFGINAKRVKQAYQQTLLNYKKKCYRAMYDAFNTEQSMTAFFHSLGHDDVWIAKRIQGLKTTANLAYTWLKREVPLEHHIYLSDIISQGTF